MDMGSSTRFCRHSLTSDTGREVWIHISCKRQRLWIIRIHDTLQQAGRASIAGQQSSFSSKMFKISKMFWQSHWYWSLKPEVSWSILPSSSNYPLPFPYPFPTWHQPLNMSPFRFPRAKPIHWSIRNGFGGRAPFWGKSDKHPRWPRKRHIGRRDNALCIRSTLSHLSASCRADRHHLFFVGGKIVKAGCTCRFHMLISGFLVRKWFSRGISQLII